MSDSRVPHQSKARFGQWVVQHHWLVFFVCVAVALLAASGVRHLGFNNDYRIFFSPDNPHLTAFEEMQRKYTRSDNIMFVVLPSSGSDIFTPSVMGAIEELTEKSWLLPHSSRVDSVTNYQYTVAEDDDLIVANFIENAAEMSLEALHERKKIALKEPLLVNRLVGPNAEAAGVTITFLLPGKVADEAFASVNAARDYVKEIEAAYPVKVYIQGTMMLDASFFEASMHDFSTLIPLMFLVITAIIYAMVRSVSATLATLIVIVLSIMTAMGLAGWVGLELTSPSSSAVIIIMTLAIADSVHIIMTMMSEMKKGNTKKQAIVESVRINFQPVFLTSVTTAIGFLTMNFSDTPPFWDLGNITAAGVMVAFVYSIFILPALLVILPVKASSADINMTAGLVKFGDGVIKKQRPILITSALIGGLLLACIPLNEMNDDFVEYFDESTDFYKATEITMDNLSGVYQIYFSLDSGESNGISSPEFLHSVEAFLGWLRQQPKVRHADAITETFKRLNQNLHGDDPAWYRLPENKAMASQYLLLYEMSLPYGLGLTDQINIDKSSIRLRVTLDKMTSNELLATTHAAEQWLRDNTQFTAFGTGTAVMFSYITSSNVNGMMVGTLTAIVMISFVLMFALRSFKLGLLSLIPNLLPVGITFGLWGLLIGQINLGVVMVMGMTLGIVVDDSVHFLSKYLRARRERNATAEQAIHYAFQQVGSAILVTTIVLLCGFLVLAQSDFAMNANMGILTAVAVTVAMIADFTLLPALLLWMDGKPEEVDSVVIPVSELDVNA